MIRACGGSLPRCDGPGCGRSGGAASVHSSIGKSSRASSTASFRQSGYSIRYPVTVSTPEPEGGARCVSSARRDLRGGSGATRFPTVTEWASEGLVEIQRADVFMEELKGDDRVAKGKRVQPHPGLFTIGQSVLGGGDVLVGPDMTTDIKEILFPTAHTLTPNQENDIQHLSEHVRVGNDVFVTLNTKDFVKHGKQAALAERGIWVFTPSEIVDLLERLYGWP